MDNTDQIMIIADNPLARMGLAALLAELDGYAVVGQVPANHDLPHRVAAYEPDVILWDLGWEPDIDQLGDLAALGIPIITLLRDDTDAAEIWNAGAAGILPQGVETEQLIAALNAVHQNLTVIDNTISEAIFPRTTPQSPQSETLTPRELEVVQLLARGLPNKVIAQELEISEHTVKFHVTAIMTKLGAQSRTEAVVRAMQQGLIAL